MIRFCIQLRMFEFYKSSRTLFDNSVCIYQVFLVEFNELMFHRNVELKLILQEQGD